MRKGSKRLHPDTPCDDRDLEPEMRKCAVCRYCYITLKDADEWKCGRRKGCNFEPIDKQTKEGVKDAEEEWHRQVMEEMTIQQLMEQEPELFEV